MLHRRVLSSSMWTMPARHIKVAIACMVLANWKDGKIFSDELGEVEVPRGSFITSLNNMKEHTGLSIQIIRTALKNLEKCGFLTQKPTHRFSLITITKFDYYQDPSRWSNTESNTPLTRRQHAPNTDIIKKEGNNTLADKDPLAEQVDQVTSHYKTVHPKSRRYKKGSKTWKAVHARLASFTVADICRAIDGNANDPWYREKNKHELVFICQSDERIDEMLRKHEQQSRGGVGSGLSKEQQAVMEAMRRRIEAMD